jgi:bifunctional non-homologous end joining protein LigD
MIAPSRKQYVDNYPAARIAKALSGVAGKPFPGFLEPALATLTHKAPGSGWVHEIKFDGYRLQCHIRDGYSQFFTRRGYDWTKRFKSLVDAVWPLKTRTAIIDGEVIVPTETGLSDFGALESDLGSGRSDRFIYYAFDLLYLDELDLRGCALVDRKKVLQVLLADAGAPLAYSEHFETDGAVLFKQACSMQIEGLVSKKKDGRYQSGRVNNWMKMTCRERETFVVAGIAYKGEKFDGIYLGRQTGDGLQYAGKVEHGFSEAEVKKLKARAKKLVVKRSPLTTKVSKPKAAWLKPQLLADVEYRAVTGAGKLRHPSFKGLREDL